jgi:NADH:ubiquinone oxidoreductase subunit 4 (subunit M)
MEEATKAMISMANQHGVGMVVAAVFIALYVLERRAHSSERDSHLKTADKLLELSTTSIRADVEHAAAIRTLSRVLDSVDRRLS